MVRVLVVDDSVFMRKIISDMLEKHSQISVVGTAKDGHDAIAKITALKPDVVTMDVEMPGMDGVAVVESVMQRCPVPIVMVSSTTKQGAEVTLRALSAGAVDFCTKPDHGALSSIAEIASELQRKVLVAARATIGTSRTQRRQPHHILKSGGSFAYVAIGTSTGGPRALEKVLSQLPESFPLPVLIVQHMPPGFTASLAQRLNKLCAIRVKEAEHAELTQPGTAYIAPGDRHMTCVECASSGSLEILLERSEPVRGHRPSVDVLLKSLARLGDYRGVVVILTGMGSDGADGAAELHALGARVLVENPETALIGGMPGSVVSRSCADEVLELSQIGLRLVSICS